jgi:cell division protein FtsW
VNYKGARLLEKRRNARNVSGLESLSFRRHRPDYVIVILISALLVVGAVVVYAIGPGLTNGKNLPENYFSTKQLTAIAIGVIGFIIAGSVQMHNWKKLQTPIIIIAGIVAILVRVVGEEINGAHRWIQVGGFSFQAAELIKLAIVLWLASFLTRKAIGDQKARDKDTFKWLGVLLGLIAVVVAGLHSDLGSAAVMMAVVGITAYTSGLPVKKLASIGAVVAVIALVAVVSTPYRRDRVSTFLNPTADCQVEGYQACQAIITIGSGGLFGKGLGRSVQAYGYLPFPENDSIFAIVGEKFGFVGSVVIVGLFWALFRRIANIAKSAPTDYSRLLVTGILVWLSTQMIINIGAMVGLLPLKGITLPFVSYGGTSIIFVMIAMGIVFQVSRYTDLTSGQLKNERHSDVRPTIRYSRRV